MRPPTQQPSSQVISQRRQVPNIMPFARHPSQRPYILTTRTPSNQHQHRPWSATPLRGTTWQQDSYHPPLDLLSIEGSNQPRRTFNQSPVEGEETGSQEPAPSFDETLQSSWPLSQTRERNYSRPVGHINEEPVFFHDQVRLGELSDQHFNHISSPRGALVPRNRHTFPPSKHSNDETRRQEQPDLASSNPGKLACEESQPLSRPGSVSEVRVPVKIQFLEPSTRQQPPYLGSKTPWEIILHLSASTKASELCLQAASHVNTTLDTNEHMDGTTFEVRNKDGRVLDGQDDISTAITSGETLFLAKYTQATVQRPHEESSLDPLGLNLIPNSGTTPHLQAFPFIDRGDQVPPPRKLPFTPRLSTATGDSRAQIAVSARSSLAQPPDPVHRSPIEALQETSSLSIDENTINVAGKKRSAPRQTASRQSRRQKNGLGKPVASDELSDSASSAVPDKVTTRSATAQRNKMQPSGEHQQARVVPETAEARTGVEGTEITSLADSSCMTCRRQKSRCDRAMPECGSCVQKGRKCHYPSTRRKTVIDADGDQSHIKGDIHRSITSGGQPPSPSQSTLNTTIQATPVMRDIAIQACADPVMQDATTQSASMTQAVAVQTMEAEETSKDVDMKDAAMNTTTMGVDAAMETSNCNEIWLPHSQLFVLVSWAKDRYAEQLKKAADVLRKTNPSKKDYREKLGIAAQYRLEFELELREMCEKTLDD